MEILSTPVSCETHSVMPLDLPEVGEFATLDPEPHKILVLDQDGNTSQLMNEALDPEKFEMQCHRHPEEITHVDPDVSLLVWDLSAPFEEGLNSLAAMKARVPRLRIVLLASPEALAFAPSIRMASVEAFLFKPLRMPDLRSIIERVVKRPKLADVQLPPSPLTVIQKNQSMSTDSDMAIEGLRLGLIGSSPEMLKVVSLVKKIGRSTVNVLVTGESGTGKEMVANAIHKVSDRAAKPFIAINCAAIPRELLESELFGHARGAFTGATTARRGLFEEAHEGTILLDEIGDLPMSLQAKILRLLQTRQVKPLGQNSSREVDVRIISATHKNLKALIQKGEFREDLYYRLNVMPIHLPPLRERKDDILLLAEHFLKRYADRTRTKPLSLSRKACSKLQGLQWRGNVRELENVIERAIVLSDGIQLSEADIMTEEIDSLQVSAEDLFNSGMSLKDIEREYIRYVLGKTGNRKEAATRILGIDRKTLYRKERLYGITVSSSGSGSSGSGKIGSASTGGGEMGGAEGGGVGG
jgi:DNA-binding NtrC family response regulator